MHRALALVLIGLLVHFQVVGLACYCAHDDDECAAHATHAAHTPEANPGHVHAGHAHHAHAALARHDDDAAAPSKPEDAKHDHHDGSYPCECAPALAFAPPETATLTAGAEDGRWTLVPHRTTQFGGLEALERVASARHARPPPLGHGISSHAPWCLPGLQI